MGGLRLCEGGGIADANTDANGMTTFSGPFRGGGYSDWNGGERLYVVVAGERLTSLFPGFEIGFNSADINGDLQVDAADEDLFASDLLGSYNYRSDFNWDGVVNISDSALFYSGLGASCESGVSAVNPSQIPRQCRLYASYPNPFNPVATIPFSLPDSRKVSLEIFDTSGRLVCTLVDQAEYPAGPHVVLWRGNDEAGRTTAAGVYFYRMQAGNFQQTRKMVMIK